MADYYSESPTLAPSTWDAISFRSQRSTITSLTSDDSRIPSPAFLKNNKNLRDLSGTWSMSKSLSIGVPSALQLQGYSSTTRKAILTSPVQLSITQSHYPSQIYIRTQTPSTSPQYAYILPPTTERWYPPQNVGKWSDWVENILYISNAPDHLGYGGGGDMLSTKGRCRWAKGKDLLMDGSGGIEYLIEGLGRLDEFFEAEIMCEKGGWRTRQVWYMERGRLVRRVVTFDSKGAGGEDENGRDLSSSSVGGSGNGSGSPKRAETRWVYEYEGR